MANPAWDTEQAAGCGLFHFPGPALGLYYGHVFGGDAVRNAYQAKQSADFGFAEISLGF